MKYLLILITCLIFVAGANNAMASGRISAEIRPGVAIATQNLSDADLGTGFGFEANVAYRFLPHLALYAGWDWHRFSADDSFAGTSADIEETGYAFGMQFIHPIGMSKYSVHFRAGVTLNHIEIEDDEGNVVGDSDHGAGWEIGGGVVVPITDRLRLLPGVRYRVLNRDIDFEGGTISADLNYVALEIGFSMVF